MVHGMVAATLALTIHAATPGGPVPVLSDTVTRAALAGAAQPDAGGPRRHDRFEATTGPDGVPALALTTSPMAPVLVPAALPADTPVRRTRAIEHSDAYYTRLTIHRVGSYAMLPLFGAEWYLGQRLINTSTSTPPSWIKPTHRAVAYGIYGIFGVNTVTGLWNAWEARNDSDDRARRWIHVATMLAADAGFVATAATVNQAKLTLAGAQRHRDIAIASISLSAASTVFMWLTK